MKKKDVILLALDNSLEQIEYLRSKLTAQKRRFTTPSSKYAIKLINEAIKLLES